VIGKSQDPDPVSVSGMNIPDHISESLKNNFWVKILLIWIRDGKKSDSSIKEIVRNPRVKQYSMDNGCPDPDPDQGYDKDC
jgi:hypothetical protein